jgi:hypothetical protein
LLFVPGAYAPGFMLPPDSQAKTALLCIAILQSRINNKRDHDVDVVVPRACW